MKIEKILDGNVYVDHRGRKNVKIGESGFELFASLNDNGTYECCGKFSDASCGWKTIEPKDQNQEDAKFRAEIVESSWDGRGSLENTICLTSKLIASLSERIFGGTK